MSEKEHIQALADSLGLFINVGAATVNVFRLGHVTGSFKNGDTFEMFIVEVEGHLTVRFATVGIRSYAILEGEWKRL